MSSPRILIVEDEAITAADLKHEVAALGYEVVGMTDTGEDAVKVASEQRPDLVLMDITLSGKMDGIAAAAKIRSTLDIPVIFLTAHSDIPTIERAMFSGPCGYLLKPFTNAEIKAAIETALALPEDEAETEQPQAP